MNRKLPNVQAGLRKGRRTRNKIANICWIIEKAREFQKNIYFCFIDSTKAFNCVDHNKLWKILQQMGIPDHLICLLKNLYTGQEAPLRTRRGTMDWFQIGKGVRQGCILSCCLFNVYAEYIMWNARLDEAQAGIKIAGEISTTKKAMAPHSSTLAWKIPRAEEPGRLQSPSAVILEPPQIKSLFPLFPHLSVMKWWDRMPWS